METVQQVTPSELMVAIAARELKDGESVLVGVGIPNLAANLAKRLQAPNLIMVYESGTIGSNPSRLPLSIGDPCLVTGAKSVCSMYEQFAYYIQGGRIDVGFLGGAQIDKFGNINSTVIGSEKAPKGRLPGSGGPYAVITNLCTMKFDPVTGEMMLTALNPGVTVAQVQENTPWTLKVAEHLTENAAPTDQELKVLRSLDPERIYLG